MPTYLASVFFTRHNGRVYHFYIGEMGSAMADSGQDPRGAPDLDPLWLMLDLTPEGRGTEWHPKLEYDLKEPETSFADSLMIWRLSTRISGCPISDPRRD
jgi:predicted dithiol-disulfide oxidoreductase (DUF899 family)